MAAISGFRRLLRASRIAFKGDEYALRQASITLKEEFWKHKHETDATEIGNNIAIIYYKSRCELKPSNFTFELHTLLQETC
jgi:hypothetical protein